MNKLSNAQAGQMMKMAAENLRALSEANTTLRSDKEELMQKVAHFEKKERVEKLANIMAEKGIQPELSYQEKVAALLQKDNLDAVEEAIGMSAPQMKIASVHEDGLTVGVSGEDHHGDQATANFAAGLASV